MKQRCPGAGPTWRVPAPSPAAPLRTLISCRCGVDMEFDWPTGGAEVRCFGCGARFARPAHFPPAAVPVWRPEALRPRARLLRALRVRAPWQALALVLLGLLLVALRLLLLLRQ